MSLTYLYVFIQSNLLEVPLYYFFYRGRLNFLRCLLLVTAGNLITHPLVYFGFMASRLNLFTAIILAELFAWMVEALIGTYYAKIPLKRTLVASLLANGFAWQYAPVLTYWILKLGTFR